MLAASCLVASSYSAFRIINASKCYFRERCMCTCDVFFVHGSCGKVMSLALCGCVGCA